MKKERITSHVIVKLWPGQSEEQKTRLAEKIAQDVIDVLGSGEELVSVVFDLTLPLVHVVEDYKVMHERRAIKALPRPCGVTFVPAFLVLAVTFPRAIDFANSAEKALIRA